MSEYMIVKHCSPTLAGLKTGNMFNCQYECKNRLKKEIRNLNRSLAHKGLRVLPLRISEKSALIYVYRPSKLMADLNNIEAAKILESKGYTVISPNRCVVYLTKRLRETGEFPHEIGLFLGYPPEDVRGFINNGAEDCKCRGCWKVYGNEEQAKALFAKYKKCTEVYIKHYKNGKTLDCLTVAV